MISDPSAIPETDADVLEYEAELQRIGGDWERVEPLARALSEARLAPDRTRAMAATALGNALEALGRPDEAIDAYRFAISLGDTTGQPNVEALLRGETAGPVEAARVPENEAEADRYFALAKAALDAGDDERAYQLFDALYRSPANNSVQRAQAAYALGVACQRQGGLDAAMQYFVEAAQIGNADVAQGALQKIAEIRKADGNEAAGTEVASSADIDSEDDAATMLQAGVDRFEMNDMNGAAARFEAVHSSSVASAEQRGYAAYYLATIAWHANDYDVARVRFREARDHADSTTADLASEMLATHWGE